MAKVYNNLGLAQLNDSVEKARNNFNSAFTIWKKEYGTNHPYTATAYSNLGLTYEKEKRYKDALHYYIIALKWRKKCLNPFHPEISTSYYNIASTFLELKHPDLALKYMNKSYEISFQTLGSRHPDTIDGSFQISIFESIVDIGFIQVRNDQRSFAQVRTVLANNTNHSINICRGTCDISTARNTTQYECAYCEEPYCRSLYQH